MNNPNIQDVNYGALALQIKHWAAELGFADAKISQASLPESAQTQLMTWLEKGYHGEMDYMARHGVIRVKPADLVPNTLSLVTVRLNYWPREAKNSQEVLNDKNLAYVSRYALGRDYHKVLKAKLQKLAKKIEAATGESGFRVFTDSAPVAEVALASQAGLGWRGKHTLLINKEQGSLFFLGEIFTTLPLPPDPAVKEHCGRCQRCIQACPTGAIVAPYEVDARRCISYLTIEYGGEIPEDLRPMMGNRIYGCDDCQLACPWNRFAVPTVEADFHVRHQLDASSLLTLFAWSEKDFQEKTAGSPIFRIGYEKWIRNIAVALGNAPYADTIVQALEGKKQQISLLVDVHIEWALVQQRLKHYP